jgi:hypothetical protein
MDAHLSVCEQASFLLHRQGQEGAMLGVLTQRFEGDATPPQAVGTVAAHKCPEEADRIICCRWPAPAATTH